MWNLIVKIICRAVEPRHYLAISRQRRQPKFHYPVGKINLLTIFFFAILGIASSAYALEIQNPIAPTNNFLQLIENISKAVVKIAMPLATAAIVFVGFKLVIAAAQGNDKGLQDGKKMLWWVLIGTAIIIGASVLAQIAVNFAKGLES